MKAALLYCGVRFHRAVASRVLTGSSRLRSAGDGGLYSRIFRYFCVIPVALLASTARADNPTPLSVIDLLRQAESAMATGGLESAEGLARQAVKLDAAYADAWKTLAVIQARQEKFADALASFETAQELLPDGSFGSLDYARCAWHAGQLTNAIAAMEKFVAADGVRNAAAWRDLARWQHNLQSPETAITSMRKALNLDPHDMFAWRDLGFWLWEQGITQEALEAFDQALAGDPAKAADTALQICASLAEQGLPDVALTRYARWTANASFAEAGLALVAKGRLRAADVFLQAAVSAGSHEVEHLINLAWIKALSGQCADAHRHLPPWEALSGNSNHVEKMIGILFSCATVPDFFSVLRDTAAQLNEWTGGNRGRMEDILERAAEAQRVRDAPENALVLLDAVLATNPDRLSWINWYHLNWNLHGEIFAAARLRELQHRVTEPAVAAGIRGRIAELDGNSEAAALAFAESLQLEPGQAEVRQALFYLLVKLDRRADAFEQVAWFQQEVDRGRNELRSQLAEMQETMGNPRDALEHWQFLHLAAPHVPYYAIEAARLLLEDCRAGEALKIMRETTASSAEPKAYEMLAEIAWTMGDSMEAMRVAREGLQLQPSAGLHRYFAENAEAAGLIQTSTLAVAEEALASIKAYLAEDPGYEPMALLGGSVLVRLGRTNEARIFYLDLAEKSPLCTGARTALRDIEVDAGQLDEALRHAEVIRELRPWDLDAERKFQMIRAEKHDYTKAADELEDLADRARSALPVLVYRHVTQCAYPGRNSIDQVRDHLRALSEKGFSFMTPSGLPSRTNLEGRAVMLVFIEPGEIVFRELDALLQEIPGGRALYAAGEVILGRRTPGKPAPEDLRKAVAAGRWEIAAGQPEDFSRTPTEPEGYLGNPATHRVRKPIPEGSVAETVEEYEKRMHRALETMSNLLPEGTARTLWYPRGDYGQLSIGTEVQITRMLSELVKQHYEYAIFSDELGFVSGEADPHFIPSKTVPPRWTGMQLIEHLQRNHPETRTRTDLAKVHYWSSRHEQANEQFRKLEHSGANPFELHFNWGANALMEGDLPTAREHLRLARETDPHNPAVQKAISRADILMSPNLTAGLSGWEDNEGRDWKGVRGEGSLFATERLVVGAGVSREAWGPEHEADIKATRYALPLRWYAWQETWVDVRGWGLDFEDLDDRYGSAAELHAPFAVVNGFLELGYTHREIGTHEALALEIDAEDYKAHLYSRLPLAFELFLDGMLTDREDGNHSEAIMLTADYRLTEKPFICIGYRGGYADSDFEPPEYWAPMKYEHHYLYASARGRYHWAGFQATLETGPAREENTDWENTFGATLRASAFITDQTEISAEYIRFDGANYDRDYAGLQATVRF